MAFLALELEVGAGGVVPLLASPVHKVKRAEPPKHLCAMQQCWMGSDSRWRRVVLSAHGGVLAGV